MRRTADRWSLVAGECIGQYPQIACAEGVGIFKERANACPRSANVTRHDRQGLQVGRQVLAAGIEGRHFVVEDDGALSASDLTGQVLQLRRCLEPEVVCKSYFLARQFSA